MDTTWEFVEKCYLGYSSSDEIALALDLDMVLCENDFKWNESANKLWVKYDKSFGQVGEELDKAMLGIYTKAIQGYIETTKDNKTNG